MPDKILIVDDELDIQNLVKRKLDRKGYQAIGASDGEEALQKTGVEMPDLILLDVVMPGKSGFEVCKSLKSKQKTKFIPVVMFTSLGRDVDKKMVNESGADGHIIKSFESEDLLTVVKKHLDKSRPFKFSRQLNLEHSDLKGKNIILEFDPSTPYERFVRDFILESVSNREKTIVITHKGSAINKALEGDENVELTEFTPNPMFSSILMDNPEGPLSLVYDSLTDLALSAGSQAAYNFVRNSLPLLNESRLTALFLLNPNAHEQREVSSIEVVFSNQAIYGKQGVINVKFT